MLRLKRMLTGKSIRQVRVFLASSDDVRAERAQAIQAAQEVNDEVSRFIEFEIQMRWWEQVAPGISMDGPQEIIEDRLEFDDCDVVVVILKQRCGPGTMCELRRAVANFKSLGKPEVMLYLREGSTPSTPAECNDLCSTLNLIEEVKAEKNILFKKVAAESDFQQTLRKDLSNYLFRQHFSSATSFLRVSTSATRRVLRAESASEEIGDLDISIWMPDNWGNPISVDVRIFLNTKVTNRLAGSLTAAGVKVSRILKGSERECLCDPQLVAGITNCIEMKGLQLDSTSNLNRLRIIGIRANASSLWGGTATLLGSSPVTASVQVIPSSNADSSRLGVLDAESAQIVGECLPSFGFRVLSPHLLVPPPVKVSRNELAKLRADQTATWADVAFFCQFSELWADVFRAASDKLGPTELHVCFLGLPRGIRIFLPVRSIDYPTPVCATLVRNANILSSRGFSASGYEFVEANVPSYSRQLAIVYRWVLPSPRTAPLTVTFPFMIAAGDDADASLGTAMVAGNLGPLSSVPTASSTAPIPRFGQPFPGSAAFTITE